MTTQHSSPEDREEFSISDVVAACGGDTLGEDPPPEAVLAFVGGLTEYVPHLHPIFKEVLRSEAETILKRARVAGAHRLVAAAFKTGAEQQPGSTNEESQPLQGQALVLRRPDPWPDPVEGNELLTELVETYLRFIAMGRESAIALALWVVHAHVHEDLVVSPVLTITSPQPRCGKTTTLTITACLVPAPLFASSITAPALFRTVEAYYPTLLIDEADTFLGDNEDLRGAINAGHTKHGAFVVRTAGDDHEPRLFSVWSPKAIAKIGKVPDTIADRSVQIELQRRAPGEVVDRLRLDRLEQFDPLAQKVARWTADIREQMLDIDPEVPAELHDRAADNWRPLLALADLAGGPWPEFARNAALALSGGPEQDLSTAVRLLSDIRETFHSAGPETDRLFSADLVAALVRRADRPWQEWKGTRNPLTANQLADLLRPFHITPKKIRIGDKTLQGYKLDDFQDVFSRYVPSEPEHSEQQGDHA